MLSNSPELKAISSFNRLQLNAAAVKMMGVTSASKFLFIDDKEELTNPSKVYYAIIVEGGEQGAALSEINNNRTFSYAGVYPAMIIGDAAIHMAGKDDLIKRGIMADEEKTISFSVIYDIVNSGETTVLGDTEYPVYAFVNRRVRDVLQRGESNDVFNTDVENSDVFNTDVFNTDVENSDVENSEISKKKKR